MTREYLAVFVGILNRPKYRRLTPAGRGALLHLWALAGTQSPEACWPSRADLLEALDLDGFAAAHLDELIKLGWIDVEQDGTHVVHDWDQWQLAASKAIKNDWEARRQREWRRRQDPSPHPSPREEENRGEKSRTYGVRTPYVRAARPSEDGRFDGSARPYEPSPVSGRPRASQTETCLRCNEPITDIGTATVVRRDGTMVHTRCLPASVA